MQTEEAERKKGLLLKHAVVLVVAFVHPPCKQVMGDGASKKGAKADLLRASYTAFTVRREELFERADENHLFTSLERFRLVFSIIEAAKHAGGAELNMRQLKAEQVSISNQSINNQPINNKPMNNQPINTRQLKAEQVAG